MVSRLHQRMDLVEEMLMAGVVPKCPACPPLAIYERGHDEPDPDPRCATCAAPAGALIIIRPEGA